MIFVNQTSHPLIHFLFNIDYINMSKYAYKAFDSYFSLIHSSTNKISWLGTHHIMDIQINFNIIIRTIILHIIRHHMEWSQVGKIRLKIWNMNLYINLDGSFQNRYYAVDGVKDSTGASSGLNTFFKVLRIALSFINMASGGGGGDFGSTMITGGFTDSTSM